MENWNKFSTLNYYVFLWSNADFQHNYSSLQCHMIIQESF